ncbi:RNA-guided endonuclease InsQ/TnpB family protein, partial [Bacillus pseudomycoides]|uniref:RNA-guided endonuclease InsQ/TnpB family protein n=1 Tax=Bacillus pseudomycoides TaxID=64104 RepID=UPI002FFEC960
KEVPSQPLQEVFLRLEKAYDCFFRGDVGWGAFRRMLLYKCKKFGGLLVKVDPAYTSQDCSSCGNRVKKSLSIRTHICAKCGTVLDRDHNASLNILRKGLEQLLVRTIED